MHVFTPKGQVKTLPAGSTPIDFAYAVHTDVGHRTVGAKINGRIVPLHYRLQNGDFVEILTSKQGTRGPSRDWMSLAKSSPRARARSASGSRARRARIRSRRAARRSSTRSRRRTCRTRSSARRRVLAAGDPRLGLQEGGGLLRRARLREAPDRRDRQQGDPAPEDRAGRRGGAGRQGAEGAQRRLEHRDGGRRPGRRRRARPAREVLHAGSGRRDRRLHLARQGDHDPPRGLPEREGADAERRSGSRRSSGTAT